MLDNQLTYTTKEVQRILDYSNQVIGFIDSINYTVNPFIPEVIVTTNDNDLIFSNTFHGVEVSQEIKLFVNGLLINNLDSNDNLVWSIVKNSDKTIWDGTYDTEPLNIIWNGSVAGYQIEADDIITFVYYSRTQILVY